jgi:hypothetical protein
MCNTIAGIESMWSTITATQELTLTLELTPALIPALTPVLVCTLELWVNVVTLTLKLMVTSIKVPCKKSRRRCTCKAQFEVHL